MASDPTQPSALASERDRDTMRRMCARDPSGLRRLLEDYGGRVQGALSREFRILNASDVEEALNSAALSAWRSASTFDAKKGTVRAWFYVIARNAALGIVRRELRERNRVEALGRDLAAVEAPAVDPFAEAPSGSTDHAFLQALRRCVEHLPRLQRSIIEADLRAKDDVAGAAELAQSLNTSKNAIYVSRSMARKALKRCLTANGHGCEAAPAEGTT